MKYSFIKTIFFVSYYLTQINVIFMSCLHTWSYITANILHNKKWFIFDSESEISSFSLNIMTIFVSEAG